MKRIACCSGLALTGVLALGLGGCGGGELEGMPKENTGYVAPGAPPGAPEVKAQMTTNRPKKAPSEAAPKQ